LHKLLHKLYCVYSIQYAWIIGSHIYTGWAVQVYYSIYRTPKWNQLIRTLYQFVTLWRLSVCACFLLILISLSFVLIPVMPFCYLICSARVYENKFTLFCSTFTGAIRNQLRVIYFIHFIVQLCRNLLYIFHLVYFFGTDVSLFDQGSLFHLIFILLSFTPI